jgi:hypothetical protein
MSHRTVLPAVVLLVALAAGCGGADAALPAAPTGVLPAEFPEDFPLPPDAELTSRGDSVTMTVDRSVEELADFFSTELAATGWTTLDDWDGVDPAGSPTTGWTIERGDEAGVIAVTEAPEGTVVRVNLAQPFNDPQRGMGLYRQ